MADIKNIFTGIDTNNPIGTISGEIGTDVNPTAFSANLREITSRGVTPKIVINSPGGSVFGGMEIIDAMMDGNVDTHIAGMAASMGGIISQYGKRRTANDFSMLMIHAASGGNDKGLLDKINNNLKSILMSRSKMTEKMLNKIFKEGKDVWFDSSQMLELGLIDEIVNTKVKVENFDNSKEITNLYEIFNEAVNKLDDSKDDSFFAPNETVKAGTQLQENKLNKNRMENEFKEVKSQLGLDSSDTERDVLNSIKAKDTKISDLTVEVECKDEKIEELQNKITSMNEVKAVEMVAKAHDDGKISKDSVSHYENFAKADFEGCKAALGGIQSTVRESIVDSLGDKTKMTSDEAIIARGYDDISANEPELLDTLSDEVLDKLFDNRKSK